jgi:hypothetical protein
VSAAGVQAIWDALTLYHDSRSRSQNRTAIRLCPEAMKTPAGAHQESKNL